MKDLFECDKGAVFQMTALHWAIDSGCDKVVQFLIAMGTDVNATDPEGNTPLHFGKCFGNCMSRSHFRYR